MQILNSRGAKDSEYIPLNIDSAEIAQFLAAIDQKMRVNLNSYSKYSDVVVSKVAESVAHKGSAACY